MNKTRWWMLASLMCAMIVIPLSAAAEDISGPIAATKVIRENSRLVGDVTCTVTGAACITFGAPHIELRLNGFTMTGRADPVNGCGGTQTPNENGISSGGQVDVEVRGPGVVQRFRANGVFFTGTLLGKVEQVTATTNCRAGILINPTSSKIQVGANVAVRNGSTEVGLACGGIWIQGNSNSLRWNETSGNGYTTPNDDFGIGIFSGDNNLVEGNTAFGNTNGIVVFPQATNTRILGNVAAGNPPIQVSTGIAGSVGVDIWNQAAPGMTTFDGNVCVTAINAPCPGLSTTVIPRKPGG